MRQNGIDRTSVESTECARCLKSVVARVAWANQWASLLISTRTFSELRVICPQCLESLDGWFKTATAVHERHHKHVEEEE